MVLKLSNQMRTLNALGWYTLNILCFCSYFSLSLAPSLPFDPLFGFCIQTTAFSNKNHLFEWLVFSSKNRTNFLLVLFIGSYGLWCDFIIRAMNTHLNFHFIYRWNQSAIQSIYHIELWALLLFVQLHKPMQSDIYHINFRFGPKRTVWISLR